MIKPICIVDRVINLNEDQLERLNNQFEVVVGFENPLLDSDQNPSKVQGILTHSKIHQSFLDRFKLLQWIGVRAKNTSYLPATALESLRIFNIPSLGATAVVEHTFALILALAKKIILTNSFVIQGKWREGFEPNMQLRGKKIGIIGYGEIGKKVAEMALAWGMQTLIAQHPNHPQEDHLPLEDVLKESDIVTLHLSSKPENIRFLDENKLKLMKKGALLINTSRGDLVDEDALHAFLKSGHLAGAGLDVLTQEPPRNLEIAQLNNVIITPHIGFMTNETMSEMTETLVTHVLKNLSD